MPDLLALGIDIGGTFTDIVVAGPQGVVSVVKQLTTPHDPADAAIAGTQRALAQAGIAPGRVSRVVHGTTLATNAILERRDVPVAFVTTRGFASLLQLGRHARVEDERYDLGFEPPLPPVEAASTFEVCERIGARGEIIAPVDDGSVVALAQRIGTLGVRAVAVCLLHSYVNAQHERRVGEIMREVLGSGTDVVLSCDVWPEVREYERATTTVMSAFVGPIMSGYLAELESRLHAIGVRAPLYVMESSGGVMSAAMARQRAVTTIESGPAAGVIAAKVAGADHGFDDVIAFDMGGTTAKAALITAGEPDVTHQFQVGGKGSFGSRRSGTGIPIKAPTIDLAEVGAGGGSIAWVDDQGALHVGPRSAGSDPGPVCYRRGGVEPTVTDASVVLGYLDPTGFAGEELSFDATASRTAILERLATPLAVSAERAAAAVHEIANATMAGAIHVVTVQRGVDPRRYVLVTSGGAGPIHAPRIAERFGITSIVVPPACGVASALGLLASDLRTDRVRTVNIDDADLAASDLGARFAELERAAAAELAASAGSDVEFRRSVDVRYRGQSHELNVVLVGDESTGSLRRLREEFYRRHREAFGVGSNGPIEVVNLRVRATQSVSHAAFSRPSTTVAAGTVATTRQAWFSELGGFVSTPVHQLSGCPVDSNIAGPALLEAPESTVLVPPGWTATVASTGAVRLEADRTTTPPDHAGAEADVSVGAPTIVRDEADQTSKVEDDVVRYGLLVAAEEAAIAVVRAAHSQFIVEGSDAGIGILDRQGQLIAQAAATSILHSGGIVEQLTAVLADIPIDTMVPGDVFITNDPYRGGVHANDVMVCRPVFVGGVVRYFTASLIHVLDLGGSAHGGINAAALETFEEGLQLPPLHWERAGVRNEDLVRLIALNSRSPAETIGDIDALSAGTLVAANRIESMIGEHGEATFDAIVARYLDATEARTRAEIRAIDDGVYRGSAVIDDDGINPGRSYDIHVEVRVAGDGIELDFAGTSPQVRAPINSSASQAYDAAMFAVRCFLDKDIPTNSGSFRPVTAQFPRGSLLNPDPPNPCGGRMMAVYAIVDAIIEALSVAVPERRIARSGILQGFSVAGIGSTYWLHNSYDFGGVGARVGKDGVDATGLHFGVGRNGIPQVEPIERRCKLRVEAVELIVDSGGAGEWRGGLGARTTFRLLDDCLVSVRTDRFRSPPEGIDGGHSARAGAFYRITADGRQVDIGSKAVNVRLDAGDAFVMETSGGGGVGDPLRRARAAVATDIRAGKISREAAADVYGFVEGR